MFLKLKVLFFIVAFSTLCASTTPLEKISVQLKWKHQFQSAGFYMAKEKGFYKEAGLDVAFYEYEFSQDIVKSVLDQERNYGVAYSSVVYEKTKNKDVVLLATLLQSSPYVLASLESSTIKSIEDFKGKKIMIAEAATHTTAFISMLHSHGVRFSDMQRLDPKDDVQKLINKEVDIIAGYKSNQIHLLHEAGAKIKIWDPKEYGFDFYDDILFTSQKELKEHPQRVANFLYATLRGYEYAYAHPEEAIKLIKKSYDTQNKTESSLRYEAATLKALAYSDGVRFGEISPIKIQRIIDIYNLFGHIKEKVDFENFIYKHKQSLNFTHEQKIYLANKKSIKICIDPYRMPFEELQNGVHVGISADYFKLLEEMLHVPFEVVATSTWKESLEFVKNRECDLLSLIMATPDREKYLTFTDPIFTIPLVVATKIDTPFVNDFSSLSGKKIGIAKGYAILELLRLQYPNLDFIEVQNLNDGLQKVVEGEIFGYAGSLVAIGYSFQKNYVGELKIAGKFDKTVDLRIGVRNDDAILYDLLQKGVQSIDMQEKQNIINNWLSIRYEKGVDYTLLFKVIAVFLVLVTLMFLIYVRERRLKKSILINEKLLQSIINNLPDPIFYKDREGIFRHANDAFAKSILGLKKEDLVGRKLHDLEGILPLELIVFHQNQDALLYENHNSLEYENVVQMYDGSLRDFKVLKKVFKSEDGECLGYIGIMSDITEHKEKEKKLEELASVDPLTKLYNRRYFSTVSNHLLTLAKRDKESISVVMLDIDDFKIVNDTHGHNIGDDVIVKLANTLLATSRESDVVARFGGEEFVLLLPKTEIKGAFVIAEKIRKKVQELLITLDNGSEIAFTISLGVSELNVSVESDVEEGIKRADSALYASKRSGKNRVSIA